MRLVLGVPFILRDDGWYISGYLSDAGIRLGDGDEGMVDSTTAKFDIGLPISGVTEFAFVLDLPNSWLIVLVLPFPMVLGGRIVPLLTILGDPGTTPRSCS